MAKFPDARSVPFRSISFHRAATQRKGYSRSGEPVVPPSPRTAHRTDAYLAAAKLAGQRPRSSVARAPVEEHVRH